MGQGSYGDSTNTRGDSDVDVVVMLTSTYMPETSRLSGAEQQKYESDRVPGTTSSRDFRAIVDQALRNYYDVGLVDPKNKCIKVKKRNGARLIYTYSNQIRHGIADDDMNDHDGAADVVLTPDGHIRGRYFNARGRQGVLELTRVGS